MLITLVLAIISLSLLYFFLFWNLNYWSKRGITSPRPRLFFGSYSKSYMGCRHVVYDVDVIYRAYKDKEDFVGLYMIRTPQLLILNPKLCQRILTHDFKYFQDNEFSSMVDKSTDAIAAYNPYSLTGEEWKKSRSFIKDGLEMEAVETTYQAIRGACAKICLRIEELNKTLPQHGINVKDLSGYFMADVVANSVFGLKFCGDSTTKLIFTMIMDLCRYRFDVNFYFWLIGFVPFIRKVHKICIVPKHVSNFFEKLMQTAIDLRKAESTKTNSCDFLSYMVKLQNEDKLTTMHLTAHSMSFIVHGFESTSTVFENCLLMLARNPEAQKRLRLEMIEHTDKNGIISCEELDNLPYLDACIRETIRIFPPGNYSTKICTEPIILTNRNGQSLCVEKGQIIALPMYSLMNDDNYYEKAQEYHPERFLPVGCTTKDFYEKGLYYGFGAGPRTCLGERFALIQIKSGVFEIIKVFSIHVNSKTRSDNEFDPYHYGSRLKGDIVLDFQALNKF